MNCLNCDKELVGWQLKFCSKKCGERHWVLTHSQKVKEAQKKYRLNNPDRVSLREKDWRKRNPEKVKVWREANPEKLKANQARFRAKHTYTSRPDGHTPEQRSIHKKIINQKTPASPVTSDREHDRSWWSTSIEEL